MSVLFPYIVILYFIDSIQHIKKPNFLFVSYLRKNYHLKTNGLYIAKLLPTSTTILSHNPTTCFTTNGLYKINEEKLHETIILNGEDIHFISYQDIHRIDVDGKDININGNKFIRAPSPITANIIKDKIKEITTIKPAQRIQKIKQNMEEALDVEKIEEQNQLYASDLFNLKLLCTFFFINTFIILPSILYTDFYLFINIYLIVAYVVLSYIIIALLTLFIHKKIYKREKRQRLHVVLSIIFSPFSVAHATNYITNDLYAHFHHLSVAWLLLPSKIFANMTRKELALIEHRKRLIKDVDWFEYWEMMEISIKNFLKKSGCSVQEVLSPPIKNDDSATGYCPICQSEYVDKTEYCSDCGIKLKMF